MYYLGELSELWIKCHNSCDDEQNELHYVKNGINNL
jgi:hypothetical protein